MASPDAGVHETAAQRALLIVEVLDSIFAHVVHPDVTSDTSQSQKKAWQRSSPACRGVNKLWKRTYNEHLRLRIFRRGDRTGSWLIAQFTPLPFLRIIANDAEVAASIPQYYVWNSDIPAAHVRAFALAILASAVWLTTLDLTFQVLESLAALSAALPYLQFPKLHRFGFLLRSIVPTGAAAAQIIAFIKRTKPVKAIALRLDQPLGWPVSAASWQAMAVASCLLQGHRADLSLIYRQLDSVVAPQLATLMESQPTFNRLYLYIKESIAELAGMAALNVTHLELQCPAVHIGAFLDVLANEYQLPKLCHIPRIRLTGDNAGLSTCENDALTLGITIDRIDKAIAGLARREGVKDLEKKSQKLYALLEPRIGLTVP